MPYCTSFTVKYQNGNNNDNNTDILQFTLTVNVAHRSTFTTFYQLLATLLMQLHYKSNGTKLTNL